MACGDWHCSLKTVTYHLRSRVKRLKTVVVALLAVRESEKIRSWVKGNHLKEVVSGTGEGGSSTCEAPAVKWSQQELSVQATAGRTPDSKTKSIRDFFKPGQHCAESLCWP
jgi:hypothetical protein